MPPFDKHQLEQFLTSRRHIMKLATLTAEGWPSVNPVWYQYEDGDFLVAGRTKANGWRTSGTTRVCRCA